MSSRLELARRLSFHSVRAAFLRATDPKSDQIAYHEAEVLECQRQVAEIMANKNSENLVIQETA
jgi:hypothetical protein